MGNQFHREGSLIKVYKKEIEEEQKFDGGKLISIIYREIFQDFHRRRSKPKITIDRLDSSYPLYLIIFVWIEQNGGYHGFLY